MITQERLKEVLHYNPDTGKFIRILRTGRNNGCKVGKEIGFNVHEYLWVGIDHQRFALHRLAWFYMTGMWPNGQIDHINGNKIDNRFCNLRDVHQKTNAQNYHSPQRNNKSGFLGVTFVNRPNVKNPHNPWRSCILANGKRLHLGYFSTPELAHEAYLCAKRKLHEGCTI